MRTQKTKEESQNIRRGWNNNFIADLDHPMTSCLVIEPSRPHRLLATTFVKEIFQGDNKLIR